MDNWPAYPGTTLLSRPVTQLSLPFTTDFAPPVIRHSARAKRLTIKVFFDGQAEVVVPRGTSSRLVQRFIDEHEQWLAQTRAAHAQHVLPVDRSRPESLSLKAVDETWHLHRRIRRGKPLRVSLRPGAGPTQFQLCIDGDLSIEHAAIVQRVRQSLFARARTMFTAELTPLAVALGSEFKRLQVRDQKTCWGSFSTSGTISMNYAALFLDVEAMRYLCAHELTHFHHMDHSRQFWRRLETVCPAARRVDRRLKSTRDVVPAWLWS
ncbi:MAG: M48 family metallopeptidase [Woeseiaceae bacterium]